MESTFHSNSPMISERDCSRQHLLNETQLRVTQEGTGSEIISTQLSDQIAIQSKTRRRYKGSITRSRTTLNPKLNGMAFSLTYPFPSHLCRRLQQTSPRRLRPRRIPLQTPRSAMPSSQQHLPDKSSFTERWNLFALRVPSKLCNGTRKALKQHVLMMPRVQTVLRPTEAEMASSTAPAMLLLLRYFASAPTSVFRAPPRGNGDKRFIGREEDAVAELLRSGMTGKHAVEVTEFAKTVAAKDLVRREVTVGYEQWNLDEVLRNLLPDEVTVPSSFETIGHIAHLNLRDEHESYKQVIGSVMLDKLGPRIKTIVNKLQSTGGPYRTFAMEVLAGEDNFETTVKENSCTFRLDFSKVYWNSRLETEHRRIIHLLKKDDILADAFCGIGPFALPAAKQRKCKKVYANDLNPSSVKYLRENAKLNNIGDTFISSCSCAREFLRRIVQKEEISITRVLMNFPSGGPEFLDVFRGLYDGRDDDPPMPTVHCYGFVKGLDDMDSARMRARVALFGEGNENEGKTILSDAQIDVRDIRDVAPRKRQVCITFQVPKEIAYSSGAPNEKITMPPPLKKVKSAA